MDYRTLGRTGVQVSPLCLGCMNFGDDADEAASFGIIDQAMEAGVNFLDTADVYGRGASETIVGRALARDGKRDRVFLATKGYNKMDDTDPNAWGSHRFHLVKACEDSLRRLGTDHIDLYQIHRPKSSIPIDEDPARSRRSGEVGQSALHSGPARSRPGSSSSRCGLLKSCT